MAERNGALENLKTQFKNLKDTGSQVLSNLNEYNYILLSLLIVFFILFLLLSWIFNTLNKQENGCNNMEKYYIDQKYRTKTYIRSEPNFDNPESNLLVSHSNFNNNNTNMLKNYVVKSAYSCCCPDGYKNNWVDICALQECIKLGARFLDFEVYSFNNQPIVAASTSTSNSIKETYNYIYLSEVFEILHSEAFNNGTHNAFYDPMFIHIRLKTENTYIHNLIATYIETHLKKNNNYLLDEKYSIGSNDFNPDNLLTINIKNLAKKFIIIVQAEDSIIQNSNLKNFVNIRSGSDYCKVFRHSEIASYDDSDSNLISENQNRLSILLPNLENNINNYDFTKPLSNGFNFIAMKFQKLDPNLKSYLEYFHLENGGANYSFALKTPDALYVIEQAQDVFESEAILESNGINANFVITNYTQNIIRYTLRRFSDNHNIIQTGYVSYSESAPQVELIHIVRGDIDNAYAIKFNTCTAPGDECYNTLNNGVYNNNESFNVLASGTESSRLYANNEYYELQNATLSNLESDNDQYYKIVPSNSSEGGTIYLKVYKT